MYRASIAAVAIFAAASSGCESGRKSSAGFHLPDGDVAHGRVVFVEQRCNACHEVRGESFAAPVAEPKVPVVLGGVVPAPRTDGALVAAIVDPSHRLAPGFKRELVSAGTQSRMGDFSESLTVRDLIDLVAFLQSRYEVRPPSRVGGGGA